MLQLSTEKLSGNKSTNIILYSEWEFQLITSKEEPSLDVLSPHHLRF